jgi:hypothetical protein
MKECNPLADAEGGGGVLGVRIIAFWECNLTLKTKNDSGAPPFWKPTLMGDPHPFENPWIRHCNTYYIRRNGLLPHKFCMHIDVDLQIVIVQWQ